jgi:hypothetical protein
MAVNLRRENLVSRHIEVALVYEDMLGLEEAIAYLERENIPKGLAEQYLHAARATGPGASDETAAPPVTCRRKNRVQDAIVEAALKIERNMGRDWALALLRKEDVPESVALRIAAEGPRQLRAKTARR